MGVESLSKFNILLLYFKSEFTYDINIFLFRIKYRRRKNKLLNKILKSEAVNAISIVLIRVQRKDHNNTNNSERKKEKAIATGVLLFWKPLMEHNKLSSSFATNPCTRSSTGTT